MGQGFQLAFQTAEGPVVRQFDQAGVILGRSIVCDAVFDSPHVSRKHAEIMGESDGWVIQDLHSRHGLAVNGQRTTRQRLADGDQLVLAPDSAEPTRLEFRLPARPTPQATDGGETGPTSVVASIDLRELSDRLSQSSQHKQARIDLHPGHAAGTLLVAPAIPGQVDWEIATPLPVLGMFKAAGEILLVQEGLDEMLQQVANLIAEHLPGRRSVVCTIDPASGEIQPRSFSPESRGQGAVSLGGMSGHRPFLASRSILLEAVRVQRAMLVASAADDLRFRGSNSIEEMGIRSAVCVPLYHCGQVTGVIYVDAQRDAGTLTSRDLEVLTVLGLMVASGIAQIALRGDVARERALRDRLARYHSPRVVEQIMQLSPRQEGEMLADEFDVSVLFADISGFSALAESWSAAEAVRVLNLVFERWAATVFQRDGTLDKYIGDAVMAVFGAPLRQADHARRAVATALAMQAALDDLNQSRPQQAPLQLRVGINSGRVIAGDIGSPLHKSYTVIGDIVNVASRLETSVAQPGQIVIGEATFEQIREDHACEPLGEVQLRGKRQVIRAFRVLDTPPVPD